MYRFTYELVYPAILGSMIYELWTTINFAPVWFLKLGVAALYCLDWFYTTYIYQVQKRLYNTAEKLEDEQKAADYQFQQLKNICDLVQADEIRNKLDSSKERCNYVSMKRRYLEKEQKNNLAIEVFKSKTNRICATITDFISAVGFVAAFRFLSLESPSFAISGWIILGIVVCYILAHCCFELAFRPEFFILISLLLASLFILALGHATNRGDDMHVALFFELGIACLAYFLLIRIRVKDRFLQIAKFYTPWLTNG